MIPSALGTRVLWRRAQDFLARHRPTVVTVAGTAYGQLTLRTLHLLLDSHHYLRLVDQRRAGRAGIAAGILGTQERGKRSWRELLTHSAVREVRESEPDIITVSLKAEKPGDIDWLVKRLPTQIGIITAIGAEHLDLFGDTLALVHEYTSLATAMPKDGHLILNADEPSVAALSRSTPARVHTVGSQGNDLQVTRIHRLASLGLAVEISIHNEVYELALLHIISASQLAAILAGIAAAALVDKRSLSNLKHLSSLKPAAGEFEVKRDPRGYITIDISQSQTPEVILAGLEIIGEISARRRIAVIASPPSLGREGVAWQKRIGEAASVCDIFLAVGENMRFAVTQAYETKSNLDIHHFPSSAAALHWLGKYLKSGDTLLLAAK